MRTRRPMYTIVDRDGVEHGARYGGRHGYEHAEERCREVRYWHPTAEVVPAPPRLPRRR